MWRRVRKDHLAQCTCAGPDVEPIFVWRHTEPRHELAGNQAAPPAYIWLIGITASPYILTFSSHRVSQTTFLPKDTECLPGRIWSACPRDVRFAPESRHRSESPHVRFVSKADSGIGSNPNIVPGC